jgi:transcriptional repressor NrdR
MKCNNCHEVDTKVIESRDAAEGEAIRRRRECAGCQHRFTTYERLERPQLVVVKSNGKRELFSRQKLLSGLQRACEKTTISNLQLEQLVDRIERQLYRTGEAEVHSRHIGQAVMEELAELCDVAYVRFASVYRAFQDIGSFERELSQIRELKSARHRVKFGDAGRRTDLPPAQGISPRRGGADKQSPEQTPAAARRPSVHQNIG